MQKDKIKEVIVVEGRSDVRAVKAAVDAELIVTSGFKISKETYSRIAEAQKRTGVIILTDPDFAGEGIRKKIASRVSGVKHAFLPRLEAISEKDGDIGIENASPESIIEALKKVRTLSELKSDIFTNTDMMLNDLVGMTNSAEKRAFIGKELGIGYCNAKQFLSRLNAYGITREEFECAIDKLIKTESADA